ncbi:MAG: hypothetical protein ABIJ09_21435 [Pseudomonadota bacterium]
MTSRWFSACVLGLAMFVAMPGRSAQMVALNMRATGEVKAALAETLTPLLIAELSRRPGISVVSQADVRALMENEARKQAMGCDDTTCMTEIAGSLGAELLLSSSLGKVGRKWIVSLTLIQVEQAKVFRRVSGEQLGGDEAAAEAVIAAVQDLFRDGLPEELQGPASLSRLGFKAALLGFARVVRDPKQDPKPPRRRIVLDLVNTELDYDVEPKFYLLDVTSNREISDLDRVILAARDRTEADHLLDARDQWRLLRQDWDRVKEIRTRARERGVAPSGRPLRFEDPEPREWPEAKEAQTYWKTVAPAQKVVLRALKAYLKRDPKAFGAQWAKGYEGSAGRFFEEQHATDQRSKYTYTIAPQQVVTPWDLKSLIEAAKPDEITVLLVQFRDGKPYDDDRVYMKLEEGVWKIRSW